LRNEKTGVEVIGLEKPTDQGQKMKNDRRTKLGFAVALGVVLVAGMLTCLSAGKGHKRIPFIGNVDPVSRYRCRFSVDSDWRRQDHARLVPGLSKLFVDADYFTSPLPSPVWQWFYKNVLHQRGDDVAGILLRTSTVKRIPFYLQVREGYVERILTGQERILTHRHFTIDGNPATAVDVQSTGSGKREHGMELYVYIPRQSLLYQVGGRCDLGHGQRRSIAMRHWNDVSATLHLFAGGAWNFEHPQGQYGVFSTAYLGMPQVIMSGEAGMYRSQQRHGMYRWHIPDPIRFEQDLRVTIQALGWRTGGRYLPLQDDIASTAFWYQAEPHAPFPVLPNRDGLEVI
jgi:hypothetical protein